MRKKPKEQLYGNRIRELLNKKNISSQELSDISGLSTPHLSRIINGHRKCISLPVAIKIAKALNSTVEELFIYEIPVVERKNDEQD